MSHNTSALNLGVNVVPIWTNWNARWQFYSSQWSCSSSSVCWGSNGANGVSATTALTAVQKIRFNLPNGISLNKGDYIQADIFWDQSAANNSDDSQLGMIKSDTSGITLVNYEVTRSSNAGSHATFLFYVENAISVSNSSTYVVIGSSRSDNMNIFFFREVNTSLSGGVVNFFSTTSGTDYTEDIESVKDAIEEQQQKEEQAVDNISNQTPPTSGSGENAQTTSLLNTLGSFLSAITNLSATDCNVVLAFPSFAGGSQTVNICQNKEYTGNIVSVAGSIILVMFYLPVAFMLVSKIYSEIRSFTNG